MSKFINSLSNKPVTPSPEASIISDTVEYTDDLEYAGDLGRTEDNGDNGYTTDEIQLIICRLLYDGEENSILVGPRLANYINYNAGKNLYLGYAKKLIDQYHINYNELGIICQKYRDTRGRHRRESAEAAQNRQQIERILHKLGLNFDLKLEIREVIVEEKKQYLLNILYKSCEKLIRYYQEFDSQNSDITKYTELLGKILKQMKPKSNIRETMKQRAQEKKDADFIRNTLSEYEGGKRRTRKNRIQKRRKI